MGQADLAVLGGKPAFEDPLPVGQLYFPPWADYERAFRELFARQYYTNQGPLTERLEACLAERLQVRNVICVTNATIGLSMLAEGLGLKGNIIVPAFTFIASAQSLLWSNLGPVFCDVDPDTHHLDMKHVEQLLEQGASGILAVNLWGGAADVNKLIEIAARYQVPLYFDSAHGFGCTLKGGRPLGGYGRGEVFSFHATKVLSSGEGGGIATDDDDLAEKLRNIRSSYGVRRSVAVSRTANGRMSEAQAALGLLSLDALDSIVERNRSLHVAYGRRLRGVKGLKVRHPLNVERSNYQYCVCEIAEHEFGTPRDVLYQALRKENILARRYFSPGVHRCPPFTDFLRSDDKPLTATERLCAVVLQLPLGARVTVEAVEVICDRIKTIQNRADEVVAAVRDIS